MIKDYASLKASINNEETNYGVFSRLIKYGRKVYDLEKSEWVYVKNWGNKKESKLFFFFPKSIVATSFSKEKGELLVSELKDSIVRKDLLFYGSEGRNARLTLFFSNGDSLILDSKEDVYSDYLKDYTEFIIEIYKRF